MPAFWIQRINPINKIDMKHSFKTILAALFIATAMVCSCAMTPEDKGEHYAKVMVSALKDGNSEKAERITEKVGKYAEGLSLSDKMKFYKSFYSNLAKSGYNEVATELEGMFE